MYRRILRAEKWGWYLTDTLVPITVAATTMLLFCLAMPVDLGKLGELSILLVGSGCVLIVAAMAAPLVRAQLTRFALQMIRSISNRIYNGSPPE